MAAVDLGVEVEERIIIEIHTELLGLRKLISGNHIDSTIRRKTNVLKSERNTRTRAFTCPYYSREYFLRLPAFLILESR